MASNAHGPIMYVKLLNPQENSQSTKKLSNNCNGPMLQTEWPGAGEYYEKQ